MVRISGIAFLVSIFLIWPEIIAYHLLNMQYSNSNKFQTFVEHVLLLYSALV